MKGFLPYQIPPFSIRHTLTLPHVSNEAELTWLLNSHFIVCSQGRQQSPGEQASVGQPNVAAKPRGQALDAFSSWSLTPQKVEFAGLQLTLICTLHLLQSRYPRSQQYYSVHYETAAEQIRSGGLDP